MFQNKVIVITGGAGGIGKCIVEEFRKSGGQTKRMIYHGWTQTP